MRNDASNISTSLCWKADISLSKKYFFVFKYWVLTYIVLFSFFDLEVFGYIQKTLLKLCAANQDDEFIDFNLKSLQLDEWTALVGLPCITSTKHSKFPT